MQCGSGHGTGGLGNRPMKCSWTTGEEQTPKCKLAVQVAAWLGGGKRRAGDAVAGGGWCGWVKERFEEIGRGKKGAREVRGCGKQKRKRGVVIIPRLTSESGVSPSLPPSLPPSPPFSLPLLECCTAALFASGSTVLVRTCLILVAQSPSHPHASSSREKEKKRKKREQKKRSSLLPTKSCSLNQSCTIPCCNLTAVFRGTMCPAVQQVHTFSRHLT